MTIERALTGLTKAGASAAVYSEDVFSTYLYTGNGSTQTITNGIDLSTKGGMVWLKSRSNAYSNELSSTDLSTAYYGTQGALRSNTTNPLVPSEVTGYTTTGFNLGYISGNGNFSGSTFASWTFRKQPKFFDVVTYTGNGVNEREIAHNLGCEPGLIIVKRTNTSANWKVRETQTIGSVLCLNTTDPDGNTTYTGGYPALGSTPTTVFKVRDHLNPSDLSCVNASGGTYVAYLFAKSNSGGFGAAGTDSVVACGYFTGNGSASGPTVTLGWEPQFVLVKMSSSTGDWNIFDNMRGIATGGNDPYLFANTTAAEATTNGDLIDLTATGFQIKGTNAEVNTSAGTYIYLAIRRPMKTPTDATKVFAPVAATSGTQTIGFPLDLMMAGRRSAGGGFMAVSDRLRGYPKDNSTLGPNIYTSSTAAEDSTNWYSPSNWTNTTFDMGGSFGGVSSIFYTFKRAPGFMDCVCYTGTGANTTVAHNLGVVPELMIVKNRSNANMNWCVYSQPTGNTQYLYLNTTDAAATFAVWNNTSPTASVFSLGSAGYQFNGSGSTYVAYLFATCPGVSKVFSYTGNGSSQTINCGFAAGARFVLIKRTDAAGDWYVWDTARGIVSANDPHLSLNTTAAEVTTDDTIDPDSSGFIVNQVAATNVNVSSATYIGLAIA